MNIINNAYAQSASPADGGMSMLIMVGLFFVIMYFMIIRPQNKRVKEHNKLITTTTHCPYKTKSFIFSPIEELKKIPNKQ